MTIKVICAGRIKEKYFSAAVQEYTKRLSRYTKLDIVEVVDEKTPENASEHEETLIRQKEGGRMLKRISSSDYCIALTIPGKKYSSPLLARHLDRLTTEGKSSLVFLIGGSLGLSEEVIERADEEMSFSDLTFPHQLMRVILLEQIYRSFRIIHNEPYHK